MIAFWTLAGLAAALAGWGILTAARRAQLQTDQSTQAVRAEAATAEMAALQALRDQGQLSDEDFQAARAEAGRRILQAQNETHSEPPAPSDDASAGSGPAAPRLLLVSLGAAVALALGLYWVVGQPGLPDQPYERRVTEWAGGDAPLEPAQVAAVLERAAGETPDQPRVWKMLGAARFEAGDPIGAASAFRKSLTLEPNDAQSWARLGESLVRSNDGMVGADAEAAFVEALKLDPDQLGARYFLGEVALTRGETERARQMWQPLIAALSPEDPRRADLLNRLPGGNP